MNTILTTEEVARAIYVDADHDPDELQGLAEYATSYIFNATGYDFALDEYIEPIARACAIKLVRQEHFGAEGYNKEHDYRLGIQGNIATLQDIAKERMLDD